MTTFQCFWRGFKVFKRVFWLRGEQVRIYKVFINNQWITNTSLLGLMDQIDRIVGRYTYDGL